VIRRNKLGIPRWKAVQTIPAQQGHALGTQDLVPQPLERQRGLHAVAPQELDHLPVEADAARRRRPHVLERAGDHAQEPIAIRLAVDHEVGQRLPSVQDEELAPVDRRRHVDAEGVQPLGEDSHMRRHGDDHRALALRQAGPDILGHDQAQVTVTGVGLDQVIARARPAQSVGRQHRLGLMPDMGKAFPSRGRRPTLACIFSNSNADD
jgi:hypothetical protein